MKKCKIYILILRLEKIIVKLLSNTALVINEKGSDPAG
ncbi:hypothetical protein BSM4216_2043 [Bacillus smithii]|nr:hypothetical protein BSM4216_2043 [Bacillus smithii]